MASENLNVGTAANANDGDTLRAAFIKVKKMFAEVYGQTYSEQGDLSGVTFEIKEDKLKATNSAVDGYVLTYDSASGGFTWEQKFDGDITGIVAGNGLTGDATSGDASLAVGAGTGITVNADDIQIADGGVGTTQLAADAVDGTKIADDSIDSEHYVAGSIDNEHLADNAVDHDELANRYTVKTETSHATGAYSLDWSAGTTWEFTATLTGNIELDFTNFKQGQVIDIYGLTGAFTITLDSDAATSETFNKVGGVDYDGSSTNHLQVICLDDSADAVFNYTIATYVSDTTPS